MVEPWVTPWSRVVWTHLHHEPFEPHSRSWTVPDDPLTGANSALPWIVFERDRERFEREHPQWRIATIEPYLPLCYLLSGGVSLRSLMPGWSYDAWRWLERRLAPWDPLWAVYAKIVLHRE